MHDESSTINPWINHDDLTTRAFIVPTLVPGELSTVIFFLIMNGVLAP
jgi:hypothetical protein